MTRDPSEKELVDKPAPFGFSNNTDNGESPPPSRLGKLLLIGGAVTAIVALFVLLIPGSEEKRATGRVHTFVVPPGTAERIARGERIEIVPRTLEVRVGDKLVIRNEDFKAHTVGPVVVRPGETVEQNFTAPGVIEGECTVHPEENFTIRISENP